VSTAVGRPTADVLTASAAAAVGSTVVLAVVPLMLAVSATVTGAAVADSVRLTPPAAFTLADSVTLAPELSELSVRWSNFWLV